MSNCSIKVRVVAIVAITFHLPLKKSKLGKEKKKEDQKKHLCLFEEQEIQSETEEEQQEFEAERRP